MISQSVECERRQEAQLSVDTQPALWCFEHEIFEGERGSIEGELSIELRNAGLVLGDADGGRSAGEPVRSEAIQADARD